MGKNQQAPKYGRTRSAILLRITIMISIVMVLGATGAYFLLRNSQQKMVDECIDGLIQIETRNFSESYGLIGQLLSPQYEEKFKDLDESAILTSIQRKEIGELQTILNGDLANMVESDFMDLDELMVVLPSSSYIPSPLVLASSDPSQVYNWEVPDELAQALDDGETHIWSEQGFPELGLAGDCLVSIGITESPLYEGFYYAYVGFKPMGDKIAAIEGFYDDQVRSADILLGVILEGSIVLIILAIFLLLNYLLRKKITKPIEELSAAAQKVSTGDLDVDIKVHKGGAFEGLERAFKAMVESLRGYIAWSVGDDSFKTNYDRTREPGANRAKGHGILLQITGVIAIVIVVAGISIFALLRQTQNKLLDETVELMMQSEADGFYSSISYVIGMDMPGYMQKFNASNFQQVVADVHAKRTSDLQNEMITDMENLVDMGYNDIDSVFLVIPPSNLNPECVVWASSDRDMVFSDCFPEDFLQAMNDGDPYLYLHEGLPELGLNSEFLVTFNRVENPIVPALPFYYVAIKPAAEETALVCDFCEQERRQAALYLGSILGATLLLVILITFFFLNFLIRRQITRPALELSEAAERLMQGDLDAEVPVEEGETLEGLKRTFNDMVRSFRYLLSKSMGED